MTTIDTVKITNLIRDLGITANLSGYRYLIEAVTVRIDDPGVSQGQLNLIIAMDNGTTPSRVDRNIRHAITTGWPAADPAIKQRLFRARAGGPEPTVSEFCATLADSIAKGMY